MGAARARAGKGSNRARRPANPFVGIAIITCGEHTSSMRYIVGLQAYVHMCCRAATRYLPTYHLQSYSLASSRPGIIVTIMLLVAG